MAERKGLSLKQISTLMVLLVAYSTRPVSSLPTFAPVRSTTLDDSGKHLSRHSPDESMLVESTGTIFEICHHNHNNVYTGECAWHKSKISKLLGRIFKVFDVTENMNMVKRIRAQALATHAVPMTSDNKEALLERASLQVMSFCVLNLSYCKTDLPFLLSNFDPPKRRG